MNRQSIFSLSVAALALALLPTNVVAKKPGTTPPPSNVVIPEGYSMTAVATGLNFPTAMTFFGDTIWVTEEGTATSPAAVKEIDSGGNITTMLTATHRVCAGVVLAGPPPDELGKCPWRTGRRDFAVPASRSGRDL
jgi:hypothetical protein